MENKKKECENCKGTGRINGRYEEQTINASWVPTHSEKETVWKDDECDKCQGRGELELKWV